jgi:ribonuclease J
MGAACHLILKALSDKTQRSIENEILDYTPRPYKRGQKYIPREIHEFRTGDKFKIGSLEVEPIHVDHSVPGAYGFIIHTSEGPVVYTGDIRLHGTNSQMSWDFVEKARQVKPIAMITEGTRIHIEEKKESEELVFKDSYKIISSTDRLVFADFNFKDVDRLKTFYEIAKSSGRKLVVKLGDAYFLKYLSEDNHLHVPKLDDENIAIYLPKRGSGTYSDSDYTEKERQFLNLDNVWTAEDIAKNESKSLCTIGFYSFTALIDIKPRPGACYIHSASEPYNEEQEISQERVDSWLKYFDMNRFQSHCSGHATGKDLLEIISGISPKTLFPIHTEHVDLYSKFVKETTLIEEGKKYQL